MSNLDVAEANQLDSYLDTVEHLPSPPTLMVKVIDLFRQPNAEVDEIVELMRQDPSLTTEVLRQCNSSFFANEEPVTDVNDAVFKMGFYEVYRITVALFGSQALAQAKFAKGLDMPALWQHSATTAIVGGTLARRVGETEGIVFTAGLLHDVGKIVLASAPGSHYADLLERHGQFGPALTTAETEVFGFNHSAVGGRLLTRWGVPAEVTSPVQSHHNRDWSEPSDRVGAVVSLANLFAHHLQNQGPETPFDFAAAAGPMRVLGLEENHLPEVEVEARADLKRLSSLLVANAAA